ncbi:methyltransferase domain-containing protein [Sphingosinicella rhizophila]|uniref:Methyltransferase domain-containing protein n=1 Tax=Sphingosinicella rhizophila TaxID=3050082 RepID=A0ABU3Q6W4_9SPHN|nr:methyltransferase domain-containing protein [Sphingosinicella sp. GR2756]MDT9599057.1 methyltransferase domain-containing protein [Sphingosinicella sp. GR2756]
MSIRTGLFLLTCSLLAACKEEPKKSPFPDPHRPVAPIVSSRYSNEDARDGVGEAETVMELADVQPGMSVADIGAGEGYYTVRLAPLVGKKGRVLAQDIMPGTRDSLAERVQRERLDNVAVKLGQPNDPLLPDRSFDRIFMIHMYHEIQRPSEFLWHIRDDLKRRGRVVVVDADRPTARHGTPPRLLICEFASVGYELTRFERLADSESYFAQFEPNSPRPEPDQIRVCQI